MADAARLAGRDPSSITLIAVTKTFPAIDAATLVELGINDLGESRDQEAKAKAAELDGRGARWHFLGRLQTNKTRSVARYASAVHSVDRGELADALAGAVDRLERAPLPVFVQASIDGDPQRGGVPLAELDALADRIAGHPGLRLLGVMAVAPMGLAPGAAFDVLAEASARLREQHPDAIAISAGMSGDFEQAIVAGSTHVRVGSALLGRRTPEVG